MHCGFADPRFGTGLPSNALMDRFVSRYSLRSRGKHGEQAAVLILAEIQLHHFNEPVPLTDYVECADRNFDNELFQGLGGRMDILLVDDSKTMRGIVQRAIRQAGFRGLSVGEAENGAQGLEKLLTEKPKLILSDWNMPEMSGIEFLVQVRASANKVPFGFITSEASAAIRQLAMESGANFLITKPFSPEDVQEALTPILGKS